MKKLDLIWGVALVAVSFLLLSPFTKGIYEMLNENHPFVLGFVKFLILATMGDFLAKRIMNGKWSMLKGAWQKAIAWGVIGVVVSFMFKLFPIGVTGLINAGILPDGKGLWGRFLFGFYNSLIANLVFGPVFMAAHRISDTFIEHKADGKELSLWDVVDDINWSEFIQVVVGKTIPYFWMPAHIITFMLSENYRILFAAYLSICLGVILGVTNKGKSPKPSTAV